MQVISYKAFCKDATYVDKIIGFFTAGKYSHTELRFSDGLCFSISARDKVGRFKKINIKPSNWDIIDLPFINKEREQEIKEICNKFVGVPYDYLGAFTSIGGLCIEKKNRIYCTEVCANILRKYEPRIEEGCRYTPASFREFLISLGLKNAKKT